jgi:hypothetical protein
MLSGQYTVIVAKSARRSRSTCMSKKVELGPTHPSRTCHAKVAGNIKLPLQAPAGGPSTPRHPPTITSSTPSAVATRSIALAHARCTHLADHTPHERSSPQRKGITPGIAEVEALEYSGISGEPGRLLASLAMDQWRVAVGSRDSWAVMTICANTANTKHVTDTSVVGPLPILDAHPIRPWPLLRCRLLRSPLQAPRMARIRRSRFRRWKGMGRV